MEEKSKDFNKWAQLDVPGKTGKQCRKRWFGYLQPGVRNTDLSDKEIEVLKDLAFHHSSWKEIAKLFNQKVYPNQYIVRTNEFLRYSFLKLKESESKELPKKPRTLLNLPRPPLARDKIGQIARQSSLQLEGSSYQSNVPQSGLSLDSFSQPQEILSGSLSPYFERGGLFSPASNEFEEAIDDSRYSDIFSQSSMWSRELASTPDSSGLQSPSGLSDYDGAEFGEEI